MSGKPTPQSPTVKVIGIWRPDIDGPIQPKEGSIDAEKLKIMRQRLQDEERSSTGEAAIQLNLLDGDGGTKA